MDNKGTELAQLASRPRLVRDVSFGFVSPGSDGSENRLYVAKRKDLRVRETVIRVPGLLPDPVVDFLYQEPLILLGWASHCLSDRRRKCGLLRGVERARKGVGNVACVACLSSFGRRCSEILYWRARMVFRAPFPSFAACLELLKAKVRAAQCETPSSVS